MLHLSTAHVITQAAVREARKRTLGWHRCRRPSSTHAPQLQRVDGCVEPSSTTGIAIGCEAIRVREVELSKFAPDQVNTSRSSPSCTVVTQDEGTIKTVG